MKDAEYIKGLIEEMLRIQFLAGQAAANRDFLAVTDHASMVVSYQREIDEIIEAQLHSEKWNEFLKDGERPLDRFLRERDDLTALLEIHRKALSQLQAPQ